MNRITYNLVGNSVGTFDWTCPAGVTTVFLQAMQGTTKYGPIREIAVVPDTTYTITINSTSFLVNTPNTFGSLFSWTGGGRLAIIWSE